MGIVTYVGLVVNVDGEIEILKGTPFPPPFLARYTCLVYYTCHASSYLHFLVHYTCYTSSYLYSLASEHANTRVAAIKEHGEAGADGKYAAKYGVLFEKTANTRTSLPRSSSSFPSLPSLLCTTYS